jgi:hypothetical protein
MPERRNVRQMYRSLWAINAIAGFVVIIAGIVIFEKWRENLGLVSQPSLLILSALVVLVLLMFQGIKGAAAAWVTSADIEVGREGVYIYLRPGHPTMIPWETMRQAQIKQVQPTLLFPTRFRDVQIYAVRVPGLGLVYRLAGLEYGQGLTPVIVISSDHERFERLLQKLIPDTAVAAEQV